ncbi:MAG: hypothetical protein JWQ01_3126 [Massilia sp.]|nr:hypothetical protein [Massilia sp.]
MAIEEPRISVALTSNNGRVSILIRRSDADDAKPDEPLRWVCWQLGAIEHEGYLAACQRIGNAVMRLLATPHADLLAQHPLLVPSDVMSDLDRLTDLINDLIQRSIRERTSSYVAAPDAIFARDATLLAQTSLPEQWPTFREAISRF